MANWCNNNVAFEGNEAALEQIKADFIKMINRENEEYCGQLPGYISEKRGYFFDIIWEDGDCIFNYQTKWSPNTDILIQIAERYNVEFIHDYEEMGNLIYGRNIYENENLTEIDIEDEDFRQYYYNDETETYHFRGETYDSDCGILETLLEDKIKYLEPQI